MHNNIHVIRHLNRQRKRFYFLFDGRGETLKEILRNFSVQHVQNHINQ